MEYKYVVARGVNMLWVLYLLSVWWYGVVRCLCTGCTVGNGGFVMRDVWVVWVGSW